MTYYHGWYNWAGEVLTPAGMARKTHTPRSATAGQFASILLDGIFMQMVVAAPDFDLEAALRDARRDAAAPARLTASRPTAARSSSM